MTDDISVNVWINPLAFTAVDHAGKDEVITPERVLEFLCMPGDSHNDILNDKHNAAFNAIRERRRKYLHLWSADHASSQADAIACFGAATQLVVLTLGLGIVDSKVALRPEIFRYLKKHDIEPGTDW